MVAVPDDWDPKATDEAGVEATAPNDGVYFAAEAVEITDVATATQEGIAYFQSQGVVIDQSTLAQRTIKIGDYDAIDVTWKGRDDSGPTLVSLTFVVVSDKQSVLLYLWGNEDAVKKASPELDEIAKSLRPVSR